MRSPDGGPETEPFKLNCRCGAVLTGRRPEVSMAVSCRTCGEELFVLPRNPRPTPSGWIEDGGIQLVVPHPPSGPASTRNWFCSLIPVMTGLVVILSGVVFLLVCFCRTELRGTVKVGVGEVQRLLSAPVGKDIRAFALNLERALEAGRDLNPALEQKGKRVLAQAKACLELSDISLEDIFGSCQTGNPIQASGVGNAKGNSFLLQGRVFPKDGGGSAFPDYHLIVGGFQATILLGRQEQIDNLGLEAKAGLAFIVRLRNIQQDVDGWKAIFEENSAVVILDPIIADWLGIPLAGLDQVRQGDGANR